MTSPLSRARSPWTPIFLFTLIALTGCKEDPAPEPAKPAPTAKTEPAPVPPPEQPREPAPIAPSEAEAPPAKKKRPVPPRPEQKRTPPRGATRDEAVNRPTVAMYLADRLALADTIVTLRVHAEPGDYFNCYYKGKQAAYHHVRLRGDGSAYLDAYLPRDAAGEKLWLRLHRSEPTRLTVRVVMRASTLSDVCVSQVEILDFEEGWNYARGGVGEPGTLQRRLKNALDRTPARNALTIETFLRSRKRYIDETVRFRVRGRLDRYYQCRYRDAERTHFALLLNGDSFKGLRAYIPRNDRGRALAHHLSTDEGAKITVDVTVPRGRFDDVCPDQVEVVDWYKGWGDPPE